MLAKQEERAITILKRATQLYPRDKGVWLRMAQVSFECQNYGDAISFAFARS